VSTPEPIDPLTVAWRPTVDDVAALIRARTKDSSGNEVGTFTDKTRPTDPEVEQLITNGCAKIAALVGWDFPADAYYEAKHLAAIIAACECELSYFPEQVRTDRSAFTQLWQLFTEDRDAFVSYVAQITPPGTDGSIASKLGTLDVMSGTVAWAYEWGYAMPYGTKLSDVVNV